MTSPAAPVVASLSPTRGRRSALSLRPDQLILVIGALVLLAAPLVSGYFIATLYQSNVTAIRNRLEIPAHAMAHSTGAIARNADSALRNIQSALQNMSQDKFVAEALRESMAYRDNISVAINRIAVFDEDGKPFLASTPDMLATNSIANYDFFRRQADAATDEMLVSDLVPDPVNGKPEIIMSRRLVDASGNFRGVAAVFIDTGYLQQIFNSLQMPAGTSITAFNQDGHVVVRTPPVHLGDIDATADFTKRPIFRTFRDGPPKGSFARFMTLAGVERFVAGVGGKDAPFIIAAGWDTQSALASWRKESLGIGGATLAGLMAALGLLSYLRCQIRRNDDLLAKVSEAELRQRQLMTVLPDAVAIINDSLQIEFANTTAERVHGYAPGEMNGLPLSAIMADDVREDDGEAARRAVSSGEEGLIQVLRREAQRKDGSLVSVEISTSRYRAADGWKLISVIRDVSIRESNDLALRRNRENLARAQRLAALGSFDRDLHNGVLECSDEFLRIWGFDPNVMHPTLPMLMERVVPQDREAFIAARVAVLSGKTMPTAEFRIIRPDGEERVLHQEYNADFAPDGRPTRLFGIVQDITERKASETALHRSRENLARAQRIAAIGSFDRDLITGRGEWSEEFLKIWGLTTRPQEDTIKYLATFVHAEDREKFLAGRDAAVRNEATPPIDFRITRPDGTVRELHREYGVLRDENGKVTRLFGTVQDITESKAIENELRRSREDLARAQRIAGIGSFSRDLGTGRIAWSEEFLRIWGLDKIGEHPTADMLAAMVHPADRKMFLQGRDDALTRKTASAFDFRITRPDGAERILHREYGVLFDENGKAIRMFGTIQDITERKRNELELRRSRENLAHSQRIAGIGSFERDLVTGKWDWSDELYHIHGIERGDPHLDVAYLRSLVHPDDRDKFDEVSDLAGRGTAIPPADLRIIRPDGVQRILHRECALVCDADGKAIRLAATLQDITDRRKVELEVSRSRENMARAQGLACIGSFERDLVTDTWEWSDEMYRIFGAEVGVRPPTEELIAMVHPDDRERFLKARADELAGQAQPPFEYRLIRRDGVERIVRRESAVSFDADKRPLRLFGTLQDVTERKRGEIELLQSRESMARAQQIANMGSFDHDLQTGRITWSDQMFTIIGIDKDKVAPSPELTLSFVHPDDRDGFIATRAGTLDPDCRPFEFRIIRPDGKQRVLRREFDVHFAEDGRPLRIFGTMQDVTERRAAELEIVQSRENLMRAQRIANMGSFDHDMQSDRITWSDQMYAILGIDKDSAPPSWETMLKYVHSEDRDGFLKARNRAALVNSDVFEFRIIRPDGAERVLRREIDAHFAEDGHPTRIFGTVHDITQRVVGEVRERELERQLLHSQKLEALGTLAGGIAHDLNNTLVPIMALSKLTGRRFESGSPVRNNLDTIYEASERARDLVRRVLAFSRKEEPEQQEANLAEIVHEALKLMRATVPTSIQLDAEIGDVPTIRADASQIHQVVTNLVSNAAGAMTNGMGTITVSLDMNSQKKKAPNEVCLSVSDTGCGMDEATIQRIFEPFFTTKAVGQGTGLGLSIVHGIVTSHGGRIEVKSVPGKGTRFDLYFPLPDAERNPAETADPEAKSSRPAA
jgi:PAS domain S-box-containing protein